ncbi:hypothetical protein NW762_012787 [Fusarium torreyae]|uniref:Uncharacterized protein n=1 Tax=Fusarium torreyae TaxID=1237075 RepID=A0A9W8RLZ3_9HYPO|nr:hypothetical protein NW762_012787 [Fusarium torreyae]
MPPQMLEAAAGNITPLSTVLTALNKAITDESLSGAALECSIDKVLLTPEPEYLNGRASERACFVWEPMFKTLHHELSGLPDAVL